VTSRRLFFHQLYATGTMSIPSPVATPGEFADYIKSLDLSSAIAAFAHCQNRPQASPNGRFDDVSAALWCDRMDALVVSDHSSFNITNVMNDD
jgi:hypothetical protein